MRSNDVLKTLRSFALVISMMVGVLAYFAMSAMPPLVAHSGLLLRAVDIIQPVLIFTMLFISFCKVDARDLKISRWQILLLVLQSLSFSLLAILIIDYPGLPHKIVWESALLCLICPTATAAAVVTGKLGGKPAGVTTYIILSNLLASVLIPLFLPFISSRSALSPALAFATILAKVFPMLIFPLAAAFLCARFLPRFHRLVASTKDLAFWLWAIALSIAMATTARSLVHSSVPVASQAAIAAMSLLCCALQFCVGKRLGRRYGSPITAGQALGQKNTIFAIWVGYTFLNPVTSLAGGFYSIWHNIYNSYQIYRYEKRVPKGSQR